jgi:hypothetical protein
MLYHFLDRCILLSSCQITTYTPPAPSIIISMMMDDAKADHDQSIVTLPEVRHCELPITTHKPTIAVL